MRGWAGLRADGNSIVPAGVAPPLACMMQLALIPCKCARRVGRLTEPPAVVAPSAGWPLQRGCAASTSVCPLRLAPVPEPQPTFLARLVSSVIAPSNLSGTCMGECSTRTLPERRWPSRQVGKHSSAGRASSGASAACIIVSEQAPCLVGHQRQHLRGKAVEQLLAAIRLGQRLGLGKGGLKGGHMLSGPSRRSKREQKQLRRRLMPRGSP